MTLTPKRSTSSPSQQLRELEPEAVRVARPTGAQVGAISDREADLRVLRRVALQRARSGVEVIGCTQGGLDLVFQRRGIRAVVVAEPQASERPRGELHAARQPGRLPAVQ